MMLQKPLLLFNSNFSEIYVLKMVDNYFQKYKADFFLMDAANLSINLAKATLYFILIFKVLALVVILSE